MLPEYVLNVAATRYGYGTFTCSQMAHSISAPAWCALRSCRDTCWASLSGVANSSGSPCLPPEWFLCPPRVSGSVGGPNAGVRASEEFLRTRLVLLHGVCTNVGGNLSLAADGTPGPVGKCEQALNIRDKGPILVSGLIEQDRFEAGATQRLAVAGGTGAYQGASGELAVAQVTFPGIIKRLELTLACLTEHRSASSPMSSGSRGRLHYSCLPPPNLRRSGRTIMEQEMTSTKTASRGGRPKRRSGPNKSDFVRQYPDLSAQEVVLKGKENGITISPVLVYKVRGRPTPKRGKANGTSGPTTKNGMSASDFVRSMPATMKAKEVVAAGKAKGIRFSANLVYAVRRTKADGGGKMNRGSRSRSDVASTGDLASFKRMALELGLNRAKQALAELERALSEMLE